MCVKLLHVYYKFLYRVLLLLLCFVVLLVILVKVVLVMCGRYTL